MTAAKQKVGRPTKGDRPMTKAETVAEHRKRLADQGLVPVQVVVTKAQRDLIPTLARIEGYRSGNAFLSALLADKLKEVQKEVQADFALRIDRAQFAQLMGMSQETIQKVLRGEITKFIEDDEDNGWRFIDGQ